MEIASCKEQSLMRLLGADCPSESDEGDSWDSSQSCEWLSEGHTDHENEETLKQTNPCPPDPHNTLDKVSPPLHILMPTTNDHLALML